jgi:hypothetical protein
LDHREIELCPIDALEFSPVLQAPLASGVINEDSPHCFCRRAEEVRAVVESRFAIPASQSQPRLMHQCGRLERLRTFIRHLCGGELAQFLVNEGQELLRCSPVAAHGSVQDPRKIGHGPRITASI